jgi:hypothetical protein
MRSSTPQSPFSIRRPPLKKIRIAALVVASFAPDMQSAHPADLPLKPKHSHHLDGRQRDINPIEKEILFQQFLEWLKKRTDHDLCRPECGWKLRSTISSNLKASDQAARSIG